MLLYILQRLGLAVAVCIFVSVLTFLLLNASGDLAATIAGEEASPERIAQLRHDLGLDQPLPVRYLAWLGNLLHGDFGNSLFFKQPAADLILRRLPNTLTLALLSLVVMLTLSIPLGVAAALWSNSILDRLALVFVVMGQAMPNFWFGLLLILFFSLTLGWLPPSGSGSLQHFIMPAIAVGYSATPPMMRLVRSGMLDALSSDYIRTARAKGMNSGLIVFKHALRNAIVPAVSLIAVQFGNMLGGSLVTETVFGIQGLGFLAWESISRMDLPVVQAILLIVAIFYVLLVLMADILNAWLDPRIRIQ